MINLTGVTASTSAHSFNLPSENLPKGMQTLKFVNGVLSLMALLGDAYGCVNTRMDL